MSLRHTLFHSFLSAAFCFSLNTVQAQQPSDTKLYGHINKLGAVFTSAGLIPQSTQFPTPVLKVRLGSPAYYAGIQAGDRILSGNVGENLLSAKIERNGQIFFVKLRAKTDTLGPLQAKTPEQIHRMGLGDFDITFIVDHSVFSIPPTRFIMT